MLDDYYAGLPITAICTKWETSVVTIYRELKRRSLVTRDKSLNNWRKLPSDRMEGALDDYYAGLPIAKIREKWKISSGYIYNRLSRYNLPKRKRDHDKGT